jgi:hypothetical protein
MSAAAVDLLWMGRSPFKPAAQRRVEGCACVKTALLKVVWLWCSQDFIDARFPLNFLNGAKKNGAARPKATDKRDRIEVVVPSLTTWSEYVPHERS